jgi:hypothetical protein
MIIIIITSVYIDRDDCVNQNTAGNFYLRTPDVSGSKIHCDKFYTKWGFRLGNAQ